MRDESKDAAQTEHTKKQLAKAFIRRLRLAVPMVLRDGTVDGITEDAFNAGESLKDSTVNISKYLMKVRPFVQKLEDKLKPFFAGQSPTAELETVKSGLDTADASQETLRSGLPETTVDLYVTAGEVLEMIEDLNRVAKIAFDTRAEIAAQFNKDLILRASRKMKEKENGEMRGTHGSPVK